MMNTYEFKIWFAATAKPGVDLDATMLEAESKFENDISVGDDPTYELGSQYTVSGRAEMYEE